MVYIFIINLLFNIIVSSNIRVSVNKLVILYYSVSTALLFMV